MFYTKLKLFDMIGLSEGVSNKFTLWIDTDG